MNAWWLAHAGPTRLLVVAALLLALLLCQRAWPTRGEAPVRGRRWRNLGLAAVSTLLVYLILPLTAVTFAWQMTSRGVGLLAMLDMPAALEFAVAIVALDLAIYWQHRWFHVVPPLWRIHRVHHSDLQFEVTLGLSFHPAEILLSMLYKFAVIAALGSLVVPLVRETSALALDVPRYAAMLSSDEPINVGGFVISGEVRQRIGEEVGARIGDWSRGAASGRQSGRRSNRPPPSRTGLEPVRRPWRAPSPARRPANRVKAHT